MWAVAVLLDTISKNMLTQTHVRNRKPCVKWINNNTFLAISDFWSEKHRERAGLGLGNARLFPLTSQYANYANLVKEQPWLFLGLFLYFEKVLSRSRERTLGTRLVKEHPQGVRKTSDFFENLRKWSCRLQKSQPSQDKNLTPMSKKKLARYRNRYTRLVFGPMILKCTTAIAISGQHDQLIFTKLKKVAFSQT